MVKIMSHWDTLFFFKQDNPQYILQIVDAYYIPPKDFLLRCLFSPLGNVNRESELVALLILFHPLQTIISSLNGESIFRGNKTVNYEPS